MEIEKEEKESEDKKSIEQKMANINALSNEIKEIFDNYHKSKKELNDKENKSEENKKDKKIYGNINLTKEEEVKLKKKLEGYESNIL